MDRNTAGLLLESLVERIEYDSSSGKWRLGTISSKEKLALEFIVNVMTGISPSTEARSDTSGPSISPEMRSRSEDVADEKEIAERFGKHSIALNVESLERTEPDNPDVTLCLDFGTAMSKAFAMTGDNDPVELALGVRAGAQGYPVESSIFITDDGILLFGPQAVKNGDSAAETGRVRFDSPKARLSMGEQGEFDKISLGVEINPTDTSLSEGEMITLYLGYLTDLAVSELVAHGYSRYTRRRFARPCWPDARNLWAEPLLRRMLAQAQILADTFTSRWQSGIPIKEAKAVLVKIKELAAVPEYLLDQGIPEPVAAAASLMLRDEAQREIFLVIDVGAGTTDFGVFMLQNNPDKDICLTRIVPGTIEYLPEAGNRIDDLLKFYVLELEGIDASSPEGKHNKTYLDSRIRLYKETLFRDGIVEVSLANQTRVVVEREEFLNSPRVLSFAERLSKKIEQVIGAAGNGYLDLLEQNGLKVVLTGGGANLPLITKLAEGVIEIKGRKIMRAPTSRVPTWIEESYPQFVPEYSQMAVAIGGAAPELPVQGESFADFKGLSRRTYD